MFRRKNYKRHILDYLDVHGTGTAIDIAHALPKWKTAATSLVMISQALGKMTNQGQIKRVGRGVYASQFHTATIVDAENCRDECYSRIINHLTSVQRGTAVLSTELYYRLECAGFKRPEVMRKLRRLRSLDVVGKMGSRWFIKDAAFDPVSIAAAPLRHSKTPSRKGIAGEPVPAANILRVHRTQRDRTPIVQPKPTQPEEFTVPTPGRESSIFD